MTVSYRVICVTLNGKYYNTKRKKYEEKQSIFVTCVRDAAKNSIRFSVKLYDLFLSFSDGKDRKKKAHVEKLTIALTVFSRETVEICVDQIRESIGLVPPPVEKHDELELLSGADDR